MQSCLRLATIDNFKVRPCTNPTVHPSICSAVRV
jgi:hypothetical protein